MNDPVVIGSTEKVERLELDWKAAFGALAFEVGVARTSGDQHLERAIQIIARVYGEAYWTCKNCGEPNNHISYKFCVSCGLRRG